MNAVAGVVGCAHEAGYKADYIEVNIEAAMKAATDAYDGLIVPALAQIEECLGADDYVDRLRTLFELK
ncbi:hypothetical protein Hanom_Chr07g00596971 [Helianthus anomalus]